MVLSSTASLCGGWEWLEEDLCLGVLTQLLSHLVHKHVHDIILYTCSMSTYIV